MSFDLEVDTDALQRVADLATAMAQRCRSAHPESLPAMSVGALGESPLARQVQAQAQQRAAQAFELADGLAAATAEFASCIRISALAFHQAEAAIQGGR